MVMIIYVNHLDVFRRDLQMLALLLNHSWFWLETCGRSKGLIQGNLMKVLFTDREQS